MMSKMRLVLVLLSLLSLALVACTGGEVAVELGADAAQSKEEDPVGDLMKKIFGAFHNRDTDHPSEDKPLFKSLEEDNESESKEEIEAKTEEAEYIWNLMFPPKSIAAFSSAFSSSMSRTLTEFCGGNPRAGREVCEV